MMVVFHGRRLYGRVDRARDACIATVFYYLQFLPVVPLSSHLVLSDRPGSNDAIRIPMQWRSVLAGYARSWGLLAAIGFVIAGAIRVHDARPASDAWWPAVEGVIAAAGLAFAFGFVGRLDRDQRAQRDVWERRVGHPVDPALLGPLRKKIAKKLRKQLRTSTPQGDGGYRDVAPPRASYRAVARDPNVIDRDLLDTAFTLARLDESLAEGPERAELARDRAAIWARLRPESLAALDRGAMGIESFWLAVPFGLAAVYALEFICR